MGGQRQLGVVLGIISQVDLAGSHQAIHGSRGSRTDRRCEG
jgi:hypothetical protein